VRSPRRFVTVVAAAIAVVVLTPAAVSASQIDNDHDRDLSFWLDCGIGCGNYFDNVVPGASVSRPGKAGYVQAGVFTADLVWLCDKNGTQIGDHGEVGVDFKEANSDRGNSKPVILYFSKGGNDWESPSDGTESWPLTTVDAARCWHGLP